LFCCGRVRETVARSRHGDRCQEHDGRIAAATRAITYRSTRHRDRQPRRRSTGPAARPPGDRRRVSTRARHFRRVPGRTRARFFRRHKDRRGPQRARGGFDLRAGTGRFRRDFAWPATSESRLRGRRGSWSGAPGHRPSRHRGHHRRSRGREVVQSLIADPSTRIPGPNRRSLIGAHCSASSPAIEERSGLENVPGLENVLGLGIGLGLEIRDGD
jgi:hypothetical protein